jgi:hypothetical protein
VRNEYLEEAYTSVKLGVFPVEDHTKPNNCFSNYNADMSIFLSHTNIRISLLHSYPDQSAIVYPQNILHAYWGKACIFRPILVIDSSAVQAFVF